LLNAFVYMVLGRMVGNFTAAGKVWGVGSLRIGQIFVALDVV
jgi:hypothetical protein